MTYIWREGKTLSLSSQSHYFFFLKIFNFLSNLCTHRGAGTHNSDIKSHMLYWLSQPGTPPQITINYYKYMHIYIYIFSLQTFLYTHCNLMTLSSRVACSFDWASQAPITNIFTVLTKGYIYILGLGSALKHSLKGLINADCKDILLENNVFIC